MQTLGDSAFSATLAPTITMQGSQSDKLEINPNLDVEAELADSTLHNPSTHQRLQSHLSDIYRDDYQIRPTDRSKSVDPLELLPSEIWLQAMRELILEDQDAIFTLLLVSRKWHDVVIATPWLWTTIVLKDSDDDTCRIFLHQKLSNGLPLTVTIVFPMSYRLYDYLEKFLAEESYRILKLQFFDAIHWVEQPFVPIKPQVPDYYKAVDSTLSQGKSWDILEHLAVKFERFSGIPIYPPHLMPYFPSLRSLAGWSVGDTGLQQINPETLQDLRIHIPFASFLLHFSAFKSLESLLILHFPDEAQVNKISWIPRLDWSRLTSIRYLQRSAQDFLPVLAMYGQMTINLFIRVTLEETGALINSLFTTSRLQVLQVWIDIGIPGDPKIGSTPILEELKEVQIIQVGRDPHRASDRMKMFLDTIPLMMPNLQTFKAEFLDVIDASCVMEAFSKLNHTRTLSLRVPETMKEGKTPTERVPLLSLQNLDVHNDTRFLDRIEGPNLLALTYHGLRLTINSMPASQQLRFLSLPGSAAGALKGVELPALRNLVWQTYDIGCAAVTVQLSALRKLKFAAYVRNVDEVDKFFEIMARYPSSCPHLEEMAFQIVSNWFLLLYMLYRRNCVAKVSKITTIHLTMYPGPLLLMPLTQVLAGKIPFVSRDLMECTGWAIASDTSIAGCVCCLLAELACDCQLEMAPKVGFSTTIEKQTGWEAPLPSLAIQIWFENLENVYKSNYDEWIRFCNQRYRYFWCVRHRFKELIAITSTSIHGTRILSRQLEEMIPITYEAVDA